MRYIDIPDGCVRNGAQGPYSLYFGPPLSGQFCPVHLAISNFLSLTHYKTRVGKTETPKIDNKMNEKQLSSFLYLAGFFQAKYIPEEL